MLVKVREHNFTGSTRHQRFPSYDLNDDDGGPIAGPTAAAQSNNFDTNTRPNDEPRINSIIRAYKVLDPVPQR